MKRIHRQDIKTRLARLARLRCTGTPSQIAMQFDIGERTVKRLVSEMRDDGIDISYRKEIMSYIISE